MGKLNNERMKTRERENMQTRIYDVKGSELPEALAKRAGISPNQIVDITFTDRKKALENFNRISKRISDRVEKLGGLTEEDIQKEVDIYRAEKYGTKKASDNS